MTLLPVDGDLEDRNILDVGRGVLVTFEYVWMFVCPTVQPGEVNCLLMVDRTGYIRIEAVW